MAPSSPPPTVTVGIDVGTETVKVVLGPSRDYEIVRTSMGGHSTPSAVTFRGRTRLVGEQSAEAKSAGPDTVLHLSRLLPGMATEGEDLMGDFYRFSTAAEGDGGGRSAEVTYDGAERTFSSSALLAMLLGRVKRSVDATLDRLGGGAASEGGKEKERMRYVISLPPGYSPAAKRAVLDAAYAAGLCGSEEEDGGYEARVADAAECAAAAYGRKWAKDGISRTVAVVDMGHSRTTVAVLRLEGGGEDEEMQDAEADGSEGVKDEKKDEGDGEGVSAEGKNEEKLPEKAAVTVLGAASSPALGVGNVDVRLWRHFASSLPGLSDLEPASRGGQRLLDGCRKLKHLLSMLSSGSVTVECLGSDERDVTLTVTRDVLRDLCRAEAEALSALIEEAVKSAGVASLSDIDSIEVLGGGCRIPMFQDTILASLGREGGQPERDLSRGLDDTSAALGAAALGDDEVGPRLVTRTSAAAADEKEELTDADRERRKELLDAERTMAALDAEMARRSEARNRIEAHVLEMRSARHGVHGALLPKAAELDPYLDSLDGWLFSDECDGFGVEDMEAKLADVLKTTDGMCADYFAAVKKEAEEKEREMEEEARRAEAEREAEGGDGDDDDHDNRRLPKKRRMEIVMKNKNEANELLKDGNYRHAAARYHKALTHCGKFHDLTPDDEEEVKAAKLTLHLNLSLAYMKLDKPDNALRSCNDALDIDPENVKALFRRASVYYEKKKWAEAAADAKRAADGTPDDKAIKKLQARIDQQLKRQKAKEKKMAQKMFG